MLRAFFSLINSIDSNYHRMIGFPIVLVAPPELREIDNIQWRSSAPKSGGGGAQPFFQKKVKSKKKKKKKVRSGVKALHRTIVDGGGGGLMVLQNSALLSKLYCYQSLLQCIGRGVWGSSVGIYC